MLRWKIAQWFELRWWKNYLSAKSKEEYIRWKKNYWLSLIHNLAVEKDIERAEHIADLGCGPFGLALANADWRKDLTAVDPLLNEYEQAIDFFRKEDYPDTHFMTRSLEDFSTVQEFDLVFCMNAINHVHNIERAFDTVCGSCTPQGKIVLSIDAHNYSFFKHLFRLVPGDILHPHQYDLAEYKSFLAKRDCTIVKEVCIKKEFFFNHYVLIAIKK